MTAREYLQTIMPSKAMVDSFLDKTIHEDPVRNHHGATHISELGWLRKSARLFNGVDGSRTFNTYGG